jgi:PAS domain S-box-containing protein
VSATPFLAAGYGLLYERQNVEVVRQRVRLARLPKAFEGFHIAQLSDIHIGPFTTAEYIRRCVAITNGLEPDLIALTGDMLVTIDQFGPAERGILVMLQTREINRDGIWIIDADGRTSYVNDRMAEILRTSCPEMIGNPSFTYVYPEDVKAAQRLFDVKKGGDATAFHFRLRCKDSTAVWVDVQGTPMHDAEGVFKGIVGTFSVST